MNEIIWGPGMSLAAVEKLVILKAYQFFRFNKTTTANALGISTRTLDNKLEQYDKEAGLAKEREMYEQRKREEFLARSRGQLPNNINTAFATPQIPGVLGTHAGARMESIANTAEKPAVSMQERVEVQKVLPADAPKGSTKGKR